MRKTLALLVSAAALLGSPMASASETYLVPAFDHTDLDNASATITLWGGSFGLCSLIAVAPLGPGELVDPIPGDVRHELDSDHDPHQNL